MQTDVQELLLHQKEGKKKDDFKLRAGDYSFYSLCWIIYEFYIMLSLRRNRSRPRDRNQSCTSLCDLEDQASPCP